MALFLTKELENEATIYVWHITETEQELLESTHVPNDELEELQFFKSEFKMSDDFKAALGRLGMVLPFGGSADFSRMCASESLFISDIIQKTVIDVNEKGTEAAAVTAGMMKCTSAGPLETEYFIADRPFVYAIVERSTGTILFMGTHVK